mmetsp:Transcript_8979/g.20580  ORF Transcript_8979/g.20580 Transcript_8979/m.20580 type:complete len:177 (-) Transcript_8979:322-852(-)
MEDDLGIPNQPDCVDSCPDTKLLLERLRKILQRPEYAMMQIFRSQAIETPVDILREACEVLSKLSIPNQQEEISIPSEGLIRDGLLSSSRMLVFSVRLPQWTVMSVLLALWQEMTHCRPGRWGGGCGNLPWMFRGKARLTFDCPSSSIQVTRLSWSVWWEGAVLKDKEAAGGPAFV